MLIKVQQSSQLIILVMAMRHNLQRNLRRLAADGLTLTWRSAQLLLVVAVGDLLWEVWGQIWWFDVRFACWRSGFGIFCGLWFFFGSDSGVEWLNVAYGSCVFCSGKQSMVKDFIFYFWKNWMDQFALIPKLKQDNQEENKGTRKLQDNPKNQHLRGAWNLHQPIKPRHQYLRCQHPTIWKIFHLKFH